jgi:hypothetical protein
MAAHTAAQTAALAAQAETQAAAQVLQTQQNSQLQQIMAFIQQTQAAGHGEGGLGLAKGDG